MENAVDALKIAFAVMVFTIALTLAISTFSQARETSEAVLFMNDKTNYYSWEDEVNYSEDKRIVGIEAIIPTLYRYYKENYTVIFELDDTGTKLPIYCLDTNDKWSKSDTSKQINYFDLNAEIQANCPWVGTVNDIKKNLDLFLYGTTNAGYSSGYEFSTGSDRKVKYDGFIEEYANATFLEQLGEYATDRTYGMIKVGNEDFLEVQDANGIVARFKQLPSGKWQGVNVPTNFKDKDGNSLGAGPYTLEQITTRIGSSPSTFMDDVETDGEIIELAKPTIKRVIKYTKLP